MGNEDLLYNNVQVDDIIVLHTCKLFGR
jgi:hypothetical protein